MCPLASHPPFYLPDLNTIAFPAFFHDPLSSFSFFLCDAASRHSGRRSYCSHARSHFMEAIETNSPSFLVEAFYVIRAS